MSKRGRKAAGKISLKNKKPIDKHPKMLYNGIPYCDIMPFYANLPNMSIVAQYRAVVKREEQTSSNGAERIITL